MKYNESETQAYLSHGNAPMVGAGELALNARRVVTVNLIGPVPTVVLMVTLPRAENTAPVVTPELIWTARVIRCNANTAFNTNIESTTITLINYN